jgi:hypothetical protein
MWKRDTFPPVKKRRRRISSVRMRRIQRILTDITSSSKYSDVDPSGQKRGEPAFEFTANSRREAGL